MRWLAVLAGLVLHVSVVPVAIAQQAIDEETARSSIPHYDAMKRAATRGREMYLYDQAAWHATDRFLADWGERPTDWLRGYFVERGEDGGLTAVFFGEEGGSWSRSRVIVSRAARSSTALCSTRPLDRNSRRSASA